MRATLMPKPPLGSLAIFIAGLIVGLAIAQRGVIMGSNFIAMPLMGSLMGLGGSAPHGVWPNMRDSCLGIGCGIWKLAKSFGKADGIRWWGVCRSIISSTWSISLPGLAPAQQAYNPARGALLQRIWATLFRFLGGLDYLGYNGGSISHKG